MITKQVTAGDAAWVWALQTMSLAEWAQSRWEAKGVRAYEEPGCGSGLGDWLLGMTAHATSPLERPQWGPDTTPPPMHCYLIWIWLHKYVQGIEIHQAVCLQYTQFSLCMLYHQEG